MADSSGRRGQAAPQPNTKYIANPDPLNRLVGDAVANGTWRYTISMVTP
jgi:hypothetical protein